MDNSRAVRELPHDAPVTCIAWIRDGSKLATCSHDLFARLWDAQTGQLLGILEGHTSEVVCVAWSADGKLLATGTSSGTGSVWDAAKHSRLKSLQDPRNPITSISWSPDRGSFATGSPDGSARVWEAKSGKAASALLQFPAAVTCVALSGDKKLLACGLKDGRVTLSSLGFFNKKQLVLTEQHDDSVSSIAWRPGDKYFATTSADCSVVLWSRTGQKLTVWQHSSAVHHAVWSSDGALLISASGQGSVWAWTAESTQVVELVQGQLEGASCMALNPTGRVLATASAEHAVQLWDLAALTAIGGTVGLGNDNASSAPETVPASDESLVAHLPESVQQLRQQQQQQQGHTPRERGPAIPRRFEPSTRRYVWIARSDVSFDPADKLGSGSFGQVYKGTIYGVETVAIKQIAIEPESRTTVEKAEREVEVMMRCHSSLIVSMMGACVEEDSVLIVMEYCEGGDLWHALKNPRLKLDWHHGGWQLALDIAAGLHILHSNDILHLDLRTPNVLLARGWRRAKIADVGLAKFLRNANTHPTKIGNISVSSPEQVQGLPVNKKADIWNLGIILWEICTRGEQLPRNRIYRPLRPDECPNEVRRIVQRCVSLDPQSRPTALSVFEELQQVVSAHRGTLVEVESV